MSQPWQGGQGHTVGLALGPIWAAKILAPHSLLKSYLQG